LIAVHDVAGVDVLEPGRDLFENRRPGQFAGRIRRAKP
jgi:hypothetical protein